MRARATTPCRDRVHCHGRDTKCDIDQTSESSRMDAAICRRPIQPNECRNMSSQTPAEWMQQDADADSSRMDAAITYAVTESSHLMPSTILYCIAVAGLRGLSTLLSSEQAENGRRGGPSPLTAPALACSEESKAGGVTWPLVTWTLVTWSRVASRAGDAREGL